MGVINVLDKHVAELIAAGEVVERPASVIKELVENSIDAGAKNITVEIKNGGTTFMRVTDDGCGIQRDDIKVAFLRHATSKVKLESDLDSISTLGFRGEALASICAVSKLQLLTRNKNDEVGTSYEIDGGEEVSLSDAGCPVGTTFVIRDLFYNIPARAKFLKKDVSEGNAVSNIVDKTALSHPEIAFTYIRDGKQILKTFGDGKLLSAIYSVLGKDFARTLIPVDYTLNAVHVYGYVSKPVGARPNRNMQNFFINGRYVKTRTAMVALEEAFKGSIMVGKFPTCVLNIDLPFEMIDVNVHPAKIEVRFINERQVFDAVYHGVKSSLLKYDDRKTAAIPKQKPILDAKRFNPFKNATAVLKKVDEDKKQKQKVNSKALQNNDFNPFDGIDFSTSKPDTQVKKPQSIDNLSVSDNFGNSFNIYSKQAISNAKKQENIDKQRKTEIIKNNSYIENSTVKNSYSKTEFDKTEKSSDTANADFSVSVKNISDNSDKINIVDNNNSVNENTNVHRDSESALKSPVISMENNGDEYIKFVGEIFKTYIIAEKNNKEILLIDKHAAHERMIYEKLKAEKAGASAQILLQPVIITLGKSEYDAAVNNLNMFKECSFEVEDFGNSTVIVRSAPQYIDFSDISDCITEMANYIAMGKTDIYTEKMDWFYHNVACRAAIKAGNTSTPQELIDIVNKLENDKTLKYCPHGRPICIVMTKNEIEKQFGRV